LELSGSRLPRYWQLAVHSINKQTLQLPEGATECWVASIFGFSDPDEEIYVNAAVSRNRGISVE